ncbi:nuclear transport factor 2 family protein [Flavihumibacter sp. ZG627]|uniref:nuclear transport factor 2 family protein n=1 Tax=Flavihumibacter sp. ZG627 TaxID=1463156 RepID=UPI000582804F|nr:nuclear transport factor 2 family protein [Flavihumibacter sp. ZG627]KIC89128.1 hypothetical protein HY58_18390 [Flavihumibacter sp. ZG627]
MNIYSYLLPALMVLLSCAPSNYGNRKSPGPEAEAQIIKELELKAITAEFRLDTASIASVMHHNFIAVYAHKLQNRQQEIAGIYSGIVKRQQAGETMDSLYLDDFRAQFYNNNQTAIITFYTVTKGTRKGVPYENRRMRWYDVWVKENGQWLLVSIQGTPL